MGATHEHVSAVLMGYLKKVRDRREYMRDHPESVIAQTDFQAMHNEMILNRNIAAIKDELNKPWFAGVER